MGLSDAKFNLPLSPSRIININIAFFHLIFGWVTDIPMIISYLYWRYWVVRKDFRRFVRRNIRYSDAHADCLLDTYLPSGDKEEGPVPIIIFIYGGSWSSGSKLLYTPLANTLRCRNYAVVVPDYRKYPKVKVDPMYDDVGRAIQWAYDHADDFNGDRSRIYLMGHSAGAHLVAHTVLKDVIQKASFDEQDEKRGLPKIRGLLLLAGVFSIERHLRHEIWRGIEKLSAMERAMGASPESFAANSPYDLVESNAELFSTSSKLLSWMPKILFIHGEADTTVPSNQSVDMYNMFCQVLPPERREEVDIGIHLHKRLKHAQCVTALMPHLFRVDRFESKLINDIEAFVDNHAN
ncbi:Alpha/Beta hydrolase protein [Dichotomocladium elegans]|nr:Alpha/Beta hydrolase protein [Dichotomocladium elegans]